VAPVALGAFTPILPPASSLLPSRPGYFSPASSLILPSGAGIRAPLPVLVAVVVDAAALRFRLPVSFRGGGKGWSSMSGGGERLEEEEGERVRGRRDLTGVGRVLVSVTGRVWWRRVDRAGVVSSEARAESRAMREVRISVVWVGGVGWWCGLVVWVGGGDVGGVPRT
jgi:hypothetical protein